MNDWIDWIWTEEKPYPETLETVLTHVRFADGKENETVCDVGWWNGCGEEGSSWNPNETLSGDNIVAYRIVK